MSTTIGIRVDAGAAIGTGHVMRCLTLAEAARRRGARVRFVTRAHHGNADAEIRQRGFEHVSLPMQGEATVEPHSWLGASQREDAAATVAALADLADLDWLIVDHYAIDAVWHGAVRASVRSLMVIDDLANRALDADLILDQNVGAEQRGYADVMTRQAAALLGPSFALIPEPIRDAARQRPREPRARRDAYVLISLGGSDPCDATSDVLHALSHVLTTVGRTDVVIGRAHPAPARIAQACADLANVTLHVQTTAMAQLLGAADLAIGAGGTSTWERLCMGVPTVLLGLADNQVPIVAALAQDGVVATPDATWRSDRTLSTLVERLLDDANERRRMRDMGRRTVDGNGAERVADALMGAG